MSKFLSIPNGNYTVAVQQGGKITLDTTSSGEVIVIGNLTVLGETTTIESTISTISDNLIIINNGESSDGITGIAGSLGQAGIEVDRGTVVNARLVFDENITAISPSTTDGAWAFETANGVVLPIQTNQIVTGGGNLNLINSGTGIISVSGTNNYEKQVFSYIGDEVDLTGGPNSDGIRDHDYIPNAKGVVDFVTKKTDTLVASLRQDKIFQDDTFIEINDFDTTGSPSNIEIGIDGVVVGVIDVNGYQLAGVQIKDNSLYTYANSDDLILKAHGFGTVRIDDTLQIDSNPTLDDSTLDPDAPTSGIKLYVKDQDAVDTSLFFVNSTTRGEIISNNRALLYSMLF